MENENYEEVKESARTFLQLVTSDNLYYGLFLLVVMIVLIKMVDWILKPFVKRYSMIVAFLKVCLKAFIIFNIGMRICALVPVLEDFTSQILMSSSLIIVVLGFVFQEGLSNIVHGFILSVFKPFKIGDRVTVTIDGQAITGYIIMVNARHTIIENVLNSSHVIIPNSKMDLSVIQNNYYDGNQTSSAFLDVSVTYESDIDRACSLISDIILANPYAAAVYQGKEMPESIPVLVRELGDSAVYLRASVVTKTVEENFVACSDIRRELIRVFREEPNVEFAYPHVEIVGNIKEV